MTAAPTEHAGAADLLSLIADMACLSAPYGAR